MCETSKRPGITDALALLQAIRRKNFLKIVQCGVILNDSKIAIYKIMSQNKRDCDVCNMAKFLCNSEFLAVKFNIVMWIAL